MPGDANIVLELPDVTNRSPQNSNRSLSSREFSSDNDIGNELKSVKEKQQPKKSLRKVLSELLTDNIKSIVYGGLDGIITTFSLVASVRGAKYTMELIILSGFAKLIGDAMSMGLGDYISEAAERKHIRGELAREEWEYENFPEGEKAEMIEIYKKKGFSEDDATLIINAMTEKEEYKDYFVHHMMTQELGMQVPEDDNGPAKGGFFSFVSFLLFGSIPLFAYVIFYLTDYDHVDGQFGICIAVTIICLMALGVAQALIINQNILKQALLMVGNGGLAAVAAFLVGWGIQSSVDDAPSCAP